MEHICANLGVKTRTKVALFAIRHGLIGMADELRTWQKDRVVARFTGVSGSVQRIYDDHSSW